MIQIIVYVLLAGLLFYLVNWIGQHAVDFGYGSTTLFEEPNESLALNFFIRALAPTVFIVALSAAAVAVGKPEQRLGIYWIAIIYYLLRAAYIFAFNLQGLISWFRYFVHSGVGVGAALLAYHQLILPNRSLLPNVEQAGNELWLAILAFMYAAANKVKLSGDPGDKRRNGFITKNFERVRERFGARIDEKITDDTLKLITYSVLVYESYCRPTAVRMLERMLFWKKSRTMGVMQVRSDRPLSDDESLELGIDKLQAAWTAHASEEWPHSRAYATLTDYNYDQVYADHVATVMEIIAKRAATEFRHVYEAMSTPQAASTTE